MVKIDTSVDTTNASWKFVQNFYVNENSEVTTHISQMAPNQLGKFNVDHTYKEELWKHYCDCLWQHPEKFYSGLSEAPQHYMPILVDIDLKWTEEQAIQIYENRERQTNENYIFPKKNGEPAFFEKNIYTQKHIDKIIAIYIDVLKYVCLDRDATNMFCFVLEKTVPSNDGTHVKNGFHLHFPFLFMHVSEQNYQIYPRVAARVEQEKIFKDLKFESSKSVIDVDIVKKFWIMYGGRKNQNLEAYKLTRIVNFKGKTVSLETVMDYNNIHDTDGKIIEFTQEKPAEYYLPRILSIHPCNRTIVRTRSDIESFVKTVIYKAKDSTNKEIYEALPFQHMIADVERLMNMLSHTRSEKYDTWIEIGWIVYNITKGCNEGFELWNKFSKRTTKGNYNEPSILFAWDHMQVRSYTMGSLRLFASQDSPDLYKVYQEEHSSKNVTASLNGGHSDLAMQLFDVYSTKFICASIEKKLWYEYKNHRWVKIDSGITLRTRINTDLVEKYNEEIKKCFDGNGAQTQTDENQARSKKLNAIIVHLKSSGFKDCIMKECQEKFFNGDFLELLDNDKYLLGFTNGVLDMRSLTFRAGKAEDYISMTTGYDYIEHNDTDEAVVEVNLILTKIFPDPVLRRYALEYFARLLKGGNDAKNFLCHQGHGDNGKSVIIELVEKALGKYMVKLPTSLLIGKRTQSSQASPELARTHGVRFAVLQEPDGNDVINGGILKELSGNDTVFIRGLFQSGNDMKLLFKLSFICNKLPRLGAEDQATWNRVRVLPYESTFPKDNSKVPLTWEEQLKQKIFFRNNTITEKFDIYKTAFMWLLFKTYKECVQKGWTDDPKRVTEATDQYRENNDFLLQFITECIKSDPRPGCNIGLNDAYNTFKTWFQMSFSGIKLPSKNEFKESLMKKWGPMRNNKWQGKRLKDANDDEKEGKLLVMREEDFTETDIDFD